MTATTLDCDLVSAYAGQGSETAFQALVQRHVDLVYATARRHTGNSALAEDVTQQVFISLARKAPGLRGAQTLAGWLHRATVLETKARIREELRRKRREETASENVRIQNEGSSPFAAMLPLVDEALLNLRESDRLALVLRFLEERSLREVGEIMGVDEDAARKRVSRALDRVGEFFRKRGFETAAGTSAALMASSTQAAPAALAASAAKAGISVGVSSGGANIFLYRIMAMTKTQTAAVCAVLAAIPLLMQERANAMMEKNSAEVEAQVLAAQQRARDVEAKVADARSESSRAEMDSIDANLKAASLRSQLTNAGMLGKYHWDDQSPYARLPKKAYAEMHLEAAADKHGTMTSQIKDALLMTPDETDSTQAEMKQFLAAYESAEAKLIKPVDPSADDLNGLDASQVKAFDVPYIGSNAMSELRDDFFGQVDAALGDERAQIFTNALQMWMPVTEDYNGVSGAQVVFNYPYHAVFRQPANGDSRMWYGVFNPNRSVSGMALQADIPDAFQPYLQDWISQMSPSDDGQ